MSGTQKIEEELLSVANTGDLAAIVDIVGRMTIDERAAVNPAVYDKALFSIARSNETVERAFATMMFIRHVGRYISPDMVSILLKKPEQPAPQTLQQKTIDIQQFIAQNAGLKRRSTDNIAPQPRTTDIQQFTQSTVLKRRYTDNLTPQQQTAV